MNCYRCGTELTPGDKFCAKCGAPLPESFDIVEAEVTSVSEQIQPAEAAPEAAAEELEAAEAEAEAPEAAEEIAAAPAPAEEAAPEAAEERVSAPSYDAPAPAEPGKKKKAGKWLLTLLLVVLACALLAAALFYFLVYNRRPAKGFAYITRDGQYYATNTLKGGDKGIRLSDEGSSDYSWAEFSADGKYFYYMIPGPGGDENDMQLYKADLSMMGTKGYTAEKISGGVYGYQGIYPAGDGVLYVLSKNGTLRYFDGTDNEMVAEDVFYAEVSEDGKTAYYTTMSEDGREDGYRIDLATRQTVKLFEDADVVYTMMAEPNIVYIRYSDDSEYCFDYYAAKQDGTNTKIVSGARSFEGITKNTESELELYYCKYLDNEYTLDELVTDKLRLDDANASIPDEYLIGNFQLYEIYDEEDGWYYEDYATEDHHLFTPTDEELIEQGIKPEDYYAVEHPSYGFMYDLIYNVLTQRYYDIQDEVDAAYDAYYDAMYREYLREDLAEATYYSDETELRVYRNGSDEQVASSISAGLLYYAEGHDAFIYSKVPDLSKPVIDITEIESVDEVYDAIDDLYAKADGYYVSAGGRESKLDTQGSEYVWEMYNLGGSKYYVLFDSDANGGVLREYDAANGFAYVKDIANDVHYYAYEYEAGGKDRLYFFNGFNAAKGTADLYSYTEEGAEIIAKGAAMAVMFDNGAVYYFDECRDTDFYAMVGDLHQAVGGEPVDISKAVNSWDLWLSRDGELVYITESGDLMLWNGKENAQIARFVDDFWMYQARDFGFLMCY